MVEYLCSVADSILNFVLIFAHVSFHRTFSRCVDTVTVLLQEFRMFTKRYRVTSQDGFLRNWKRAMDLNFDSDPFKNHFRQKCNLPMSAEILTFILLIFVLFVA